MSEENPNFMSENITPEVNAEPFTLTDLKEKRRYVASRSARDHWGAAELAHVDNMARWIATVDRLRKHLPDQEHNEKAIRILQADIASALDAHVKITAAMRIGGRTPEKAIDTMIALRKKYGE